MTLKPCAVCGAEVPWDDDVPVLCHACCYQKLREAERFANEMQHQAKCAGDRVDAEARLAEQMIDEKRKAEAERDEMKRVYEDRITELMMERDKVTRLLNNMRPGYHSGYCEPGLCTEVCEQAKAVDRPKR